MKIAIAQINPIIADLEGNVRLCLQAVETANAQKADLVVLPELALTGCPARDIFFDTSFVEAAGYALQDLAKHTCPGPPLLVGTIFPSGKHSIHHPGLYNAAVLVRDGKVQMAGAKQYLRSDDVFHEGRWFVQGPNLPPIQIAATTLKILMGNDLETAHDLPIPPSMIKGGDGVVLICLAASPYHPHALANRLAAARQVSCPLVYVNLCGANDELIYDGRSFAIDHTGHLISSLPAFKEEIQIIEIEKAAPQSDPGEDFSADLFQALILGVGDFFSKNNLERAFLGLSGGIDSALVAVIAAEALGPDRVTAISIPSRYTDPCSVSSARQLSQTLGIHFELFDLEPLHAAAEESLSTLLMQGTGPENIQARLRALILMSYVNRFGGMLLNTTNKTELSVGYITLYGDMAGTLCPIADLTKLEVIRLAHWVNTHRLIIPEFILKRPPSAELRPDQVDPFDYKAVCPRLEKLVMENRSDDNLRRSEYKRWQMGVILKVSEKSFGTGRLIPISRR